jgi:hypothetical protein
VGRHTAPRAPYRSAAAVIAASAGLVLTLTGSASADPTDPGEHCYTGALRSNPAIDLCHDQYRGYDQYDTDPIHAIVHLDPLLCAHAVVGGRHRLIGTEDCRLHHPVTPPVSTGPCPPTDAAGKPCPCPPTPVPPAVGNTPETPGGTSQAQQVNIIQAPAPTIVNSDITGTQVPVVTH